jgi:hypothetical protein
MVAWLVIEFPAFYGIQKFIVMCAGICIKEYINLTKQIKDENGDLLADP